MWSVTIYCHGKQHNTANVANFVYHLKIRSIEEYKKLDIYFTSFAMVGQSAVVICVS